MSMERIGAIGAGLALTLAACGGPSQGEAPVPMSAAQEGDVTPVTLDEALEATATDSSNFFVEGLGCGWEKSREDMGKWLEANIQELKDLGHDDDTVMKELTERGRFKFLEFFKQNPERAKETLLGLVGTDRNDVSRAQSELGEWDIENEASVLETIENILTRSSIAIAEETKTVGNHACVGPDGKVVPAGTRTIEAGNFVWIYEAKVEEDSETGEQELVMPDRTDPAKSHSVTVEEEGAVIMRTSLGIRFVWSMVICGNQVGEKNTAEIFTTTTTTPTPSETTTTPPPTSGPKNISLTPTPRPSQSPDRAETPGQTETPEPGGQTDHTGASDTDGHTENTRKADTVIVKDNDEDAENGETTPASPPADAERDDSTNRVDHDDPGVDAEEPMEQPT